MPNFYFSGKCGDAAKTMGFQETSYVMYKRFVLCVYVSSKFYYWIPQKKKKAQREASQGNWQ